MLQTILSSNQLTISLELGTAIATSITAFAATNLDDILILMLFFAQVDHNLRPKHIWMGQYVGFGVLILASLPGFFGAYFIPRPWLGLLGLLPIALGLNHLFQEESTPQTVNPEALEHKPQSFLAPQVYQVAAVTIANGGDNIGIYVPLFANSTPTSLVITVIVFFIMIAVWCTIANSLSRHPAIAQFITRYGDRVVPFVLIGLGIYILLESKTYELLRVS
ncbi:MAG: cadmium resistance transporter [Plectolyngbya sp. WJT66-NPBG17]|jgi:cadmium resistance transport/sequestration family protein|nr:cadmium resistance transporter [Plectolyngbya sp. WJT66-NPBG17]MBW4528752.1 cadmium resistance transporter [Phormidium tanganyikae FI6-MK23]